MTRDSTRDSSQVTRPQLCRGERPARSSGHTISKEEISAPEQTTLSEIVATADTRLYNQIVGNPNHVLAPLIPPSKSHPYDLRNRRHNMQLPPAQANSDKNFIIRFILDLKSTRTQ